LNSLIATNRTMTSREIAEHAGKEHKHVMEAIRTMEPAWVRVNGSNFRLVQYTDNKGEKRPMYQLTKTECLYIATKFNDEARAKLIIRWEELETQHRLPQSFSEALMLAAKQAEEIEHKERLLQEQKPKVLFAEAVEASKTSILIGELAKILKQNGIEMGQNRLFNWLRDNNYLISRKGTDYNMPTQKAMELGLFEIKETVINHSDGHISVSKTPKIKGKGQTYFINKFLNQN
jgi:anti-repressor protein